MADKAWKVAERRAAAVFNGERNRFSGAVDQLTSGDVVHPTLYVEVKYRAKWAITTLMKETRKKAKKEGKTPVVAFKEKREKTMYYVIREQDLVKVACEILKAQGWEVADDGL